MTGGPGLRPRREFHRLGSGGLRRAGDLPPPPRESKPGHAAPFLRPSLCPSAVPCPPRDRPTGPTLPLRRPPERRPTTPSERADVPSAIGKWTPGGPQSPGVDGRALG